MTTEQPIDINIIDAKDLDKIKWKKERADRVKQIIHENGLNNDKEFMDEIVPLIEELLKEEISEE